MPNSYSEVYIQFVFAVKGRQNLISGSIAETVHKYITGMVQHRKCTMLAINSVPNHIHIFIRLHPDWSMSNLIQEIKASSSKFINENHLTETRFEWQRGYGVFSYSKSAVDYVVRYIQNQAEHHKTKLFSDEYIGFLKEYGVNYDEKYLFESDD